ETEQQLDVADAAVALHHDLEDDVSFEVTPPSFFRVVRLHLTHDGRGRDAAAGTIRSAAGAAARAGSDSGAITLTEAGAVAAAGSATDAGPMAVGLKAPRRRRHPRN